MSDLIERFRVEYQDYHRITPKRAREQRQLLADLHLSLGARDLDTITSSDFSAFAGVLMGRGLHVNTVRKKMNMIRAFLSWAYAANVITADQYMKCRQVKNPRGSTGKTTPKPYSRIEIKQFWRDLESAWPMLKTRGRGSKAIARWKAGKGPWRNVWRHAMRLQIECMVRLALDLGLRSSEIFGLSMDDLHYDNEYIVIRGKADPNTGEVKVRHVPFTPAARQAVWTWLEFRAYLRPGHDRPWLSLHGRTKAKPMLHSRFEDLLQKTVGPQWRWHRFRHTCGTERLRAGMELEKVQRLLGHASIQQTLCYAEIARGDLATAVARSDEDFAKAVAA